ncbi:hypothetical protein FVI60_08955 [Campylobacter jejuni]|nr:hypothetical protein [Campylobacter jejuni]
MSPDEEHIVGHYVPDDTPLGLVGKAKKIHYREKGGYTDRQINYTVKNGMIELLDFHSFIIYEYRIDKVLTESGELLKVRLNDTEIIPIDKVRISNLTYLLRLIQKFNDELLDEILEESEDNLDDLDEEKEVSDTEEQDQVDTGSFDYQRNKTNTGIFE